MTFVVAAARPMALSPTTSTTTTTGRQENSWTRDMGLSNEIAVFLWVQLLQLCFFPFYTVVAWSRLWVKLTTKWMWVKLSFTKKWFLKYHLSFSSKNNSQHFTSREKRAKRWTPSPDLRGPRDQARKYLEMERRMSENEKVDKLRTLKQTILFP